MAIVRIDFYGDGGKNTTGQMKTACGVGDVEKSEDLSSVGGASKVVEVRRSSWSRMANYYGGPPCFCAR